MTGSRIIATYDALAAEPERAAAVLAGEGSTGTFVAVAGGDAAHVGRFDIDVLGIEECGDADAAGRRPVRLRFGVPDALAGGDLTTLLASVAGNVSEVAQVSALRLVDLALPESVVQACPRPRWGVAGTRRWLARGPGRLRAGIVAASAVLDPDALAVGVRSALARGADVIGDPTPVANAARSPLAARVAAVERVLAEHAEATGRRALFAYTIDDEPEAMLRHAATITAAGGHAARVRVGGVGLAAVAHLQRGAGVLITARTAPQPMLARSHRFGIDDAVLQAVWRLAGVDHVPVGRAHPDPAAAVRARLTPLLADRDRALPTVAAEASVDDEQDVLVEEDAR